MKSSTCLLITASLDPGRTPYVALSSVRERTEAHMQGLAAWLRDPSVNAVVFAKNCPLAIRPEALVKAATRHGKELEFVQTASSPRTLVQGKGYGEGDLIGQALALSRLLRNSRDFIKVTGKLYCAGISEHLTGEGEGEFFTSPPDAVRANPLRQLVAPLYRHPQGSAALAFLKRIRMPWGLIAALPGGLVDTRLYRANRSFYEGVLRRTHVRVQDSVGYNLEMAFHDDLRTYSEHIHLIHRSPAIIGTSGSIGTTAGAYSPEILEEARELASELIV